MSRGETREALTGLRFWAALHVGVFHCGYASVGRVFVLSGFVLA